MPIRKEELDFIFDPSLVLYLPLRKRDGASFMSDDKHGHLCTVTEATWGSQGRTFDGVNDEINCGNNVSIRVVTGDFTCLFWHKNTKNGAYQGIITKKKDGNLDGWNICKPDNNKFSVWLGNATTNAAVNSNVVYTDENWHFLVARKASGTTNLFVDSVVQTASSTFVPTEHTGNLIIGRIYVENSSYHPEGIIGDIFLYNRALTLAEIQHNYQATKWRYR